MYSLICFELKRDGDFQIPSIAGDKVTVYGDSARTVIIVRSTDFADFSFTVPTTCGDLSFELASLKGEKFGEFTIPIKGSRNTITMQVCLSTPLDVDLNTPAPHSLKQMFPISHRGSGANVANPSILENTIPSFMKAYDDGSRRVEFDIQLTKEEVPVIYHDFYIRTDKYFGTDPIYHTKDGRNKYVLNQLDLATFRNHDMSIPHPTFRELLTELPKDLGFDIEIKYPSMRKWKGKVPYAERNHFLDIILHEMAEHAGDRDIFFSSFDPMVVLMLREKQKRWPVYQLATLFNEKIDPPELLAHAVSPLIHPYKELGIEGFVLNSKFLLLNEDLIHKITENGFVLCTYGAPNNEPDEIRRQLSLGIRGICSDFTALNVETISSFQKQE